ncbi:putative anion transporter 2, chloroplastic [Hordeum vulgare]|nr:putative anion transporter 2, chloroplastic [Hordeum vulgare]
MPNAMEKALHRAAVHNLDAALAGVPLGHLAKMATDSPIVFRGVKGPALEQIASLEAREILEGRLAAARDRATSTSEGAETQSTRPSCRRELPELAPGEIRGRTWQLIEYICDEALDIVAIQEMMHTDFSVSELEGLSRQLFVWHWVPSSGVAGHSGGILLGVTDTTFEVVSMDRGEFFVSMEIWEQTANFKWEVIVV